MNFIEKCVHERKNRKIGKIEKIVQSFSSETNIMEIVQSKTNYLIMTKENGKLLFTTLGKCTHIYSLAKAKKNFLHFHFFFFIEN